MKKRSAITRFKGIRPAWLGILVCCFLLLITQYAAYLAYQVQRDGEQQEINKELIRVKDKLQTFLNQGLSATSTLAFWVEHHTDTNEFEAIASIIKQSNPCVDVLQITDKGTITHVYPLEGNEVVVGYDILADSKTNKEAYRAIRRKDLYFAGPFELKQGGMGVVGRLPMFENNEFKGFSAVIIMFDNLLESAGIAEGHNERYIYQLSKRDPATAKEIFFLPDSATFDKSLAVSTEVPVGEWRLYVALAGNSLAVINGILYALLGLILSIVSGFFVWYIARQPNKLRQMVYEKTTMIHTEQIISESIISSLPGVFYLFDRQGKFVRWNKNFEWVSGYNSQEIINKEQMQFFVPEERELLAQKIAEVFEKGESTAIADFLLKDGSRIPYYFTGKRVVLEGVDYLMGVGIDISDRVKAEQELIARNAEILKLTKNLEKIREEERTRIAREIHDLLGQQLTALKMDAAWVHKKYASDENTVAQKMLDMIQIIDETIQTVRRISSELRPSILDDLGLIAALEWQGKNFADRAGIKFTFRDELPGFAPDAMVATQIFRIYQESLTNIGRHAQATAVKVFVYEEDGKACIEISDNGQGFDTVAAASGNRLGILGMKERALLVNGTVIIKSEPGKGSCICIQVPLERT